MEREALNESGLLDILCCWSWYVLWLDDDDVVVVADDVCWTIAVLRWKVLRLESEASSSCKSRIVAKT